VPRAGSGYRSGIHGKAVLGLRKKSLSDIFLSALEYMSRTSLYVLQWWCLKVLQDCGFRAGYYKTRITFHDILFSMTSAHLFSKSVKLDIITVLLLDGFERQMDLQ
jgi:hypothetical protein